MHHRICLCLTLLCLTGGFVVAQVPDSQPADDASSAQTQPVAEVAAESDALPLRLQALLSVPVESSDPAAIKRRLGHILQAARALETDADSPTLRLTAVGLQMQALYRLSVSWPDASDADQHLTDLRTTASRARSVGVAEAEAVGDFWLMTTDLIDINRADLPASQRLLQIQQRLTDYLAAHTTGPASDAVRQSLADVQQAAQPTAAPANEPAGSPVQIDESGQTDARILDRPETQSPSQSSSDDDDGAQQ